MAVEQGTMVPDTFEAVLDETCERLWDVRIRYSLKRIDELKSTLQKMEEELDEFILTAPAGFSQRKPSPRN